MMACAIGLVATSACAQASSPLDPNLANAAFLLGKWEGAGWIEFVPGRRSEFRQFESISAKLGGGAIVIEGLGTRKGADGADTVTHEAIGILTYDANQKKPQMRDYRSGGQFVDADVRLEPNKLTWQFQLQGIGMTRYTIVLDHKGQWLEIGEMSKDGSEWRKFFETTLVRVTAP
jgi:hypothetical protein